MSDILIAVFLFTLGAGVGSFVALSVGRLHDKKPLTGRSRCDKCKKPLGAMDMVPIIGWLVLRGKCQHCHKKIGFQPLLIEIAAGCFFAVGYLAWPLVELDNVFGLVLFGLWLAILSGLIFLLIYDARYRLLPNRVIYSILAFSAIFWLIHSAASEQNIYSILINLVYSLVPIAGIYGLVYAISRGKMVGLGDVKLGVVIAFLLPWQGNVAVLFLANILAAIILLPMLLRKKLKTTDQIPFGPFLVVSTIIVFFMMKFVVNFL